MLNEPNDSAKTLDPVIIERLRGMARAGESPSEMFKALKRWLGAEAHIIELLQYLRAAFCLELREVKPFVGFDAREITNEALLDELVRPEILKQQKEWDK